MRRPDKADAGAFVRKTRDGRAERRVKRGRSDETTVAASRRSPPPALRRNVRPGVKLLVDGGSVVRQGSCWRNSTAPAATACGGICRASVERLEALLANHNGAR